ncbi:hypothetical protein V1478_010904 [Vespula squamosa]|uniref:Uncharacterized protein n=1 Tax=Vespula squamosa TaxID=30214 RepID=A0ABD2AFN9_VESSQ
MLCENNIRCYQAPVISLLQIEFLAGYTCGPNVSSFKMKDHRLKTNRNMVIDVNEKLNKILGLQKIRVTF